jgi:SAM-dependent methyltransferase
MTGLSRAQDAYGGELRLALDADGMEIVERDDGYVDAFPSRYLLAAYEQWPESEREAIALARGRVLDVGAGAGRVSLYLQEQGHDVVAIDISPGAVEVCTARGVADARVMSFHDVDASIGSVDTVVMFGNNFGLFGSPARATRLLKRLHRLTTPDGRILGGTLDPYDTSNPDHLAYHDRNRERGRWPGQLRIRVRHRTSKTPWFDYFFVSRDEMTGLVRDTGWHVTTFIKPTGEQYVAVLEKD